MKPSAPSQPLAIIADDEDLGRVLLVESVAEAGLRSLDFDNGDDALAAALANEVAVVLLDVDMPGKNGFEVCRALRSELRFANVPIVMVTGHEDSSAIAQAFDAGATDFIAKPVNWALLPRRLEYILRNAATAAHIERLAYFDTLTNLPNRQRFLEVSERMLADARNANERVSMFCLDLNSLKRVNDTFGHSMGDSVLRAFADRLVQTVTLFGIDPARLMIARIGGDEFAVVLRHADAREVAQKIARACSEGFRQPITQNALEFYAAPSVGLSTFPDDSPDASTLFKHADTAMYHSRSSGTSAVSCYSPAMSSRMRDWLELEGRLRRAVHDDLLNLAFQPKFSLHDQRLMGVEALLRWHDDEYGDVSPNRFVEIAEDSGLILDMSSWVVRAACRQIRRWLDMGYHIPVAINCSPKELLHGDPARVVEMEALAANIPPALIEIEITESLLVRDSARVQDALLRLRKLGCRIALDDFGTGYSSLAYITRFPPDRIKIDKAFIRDVDRSLADAAVASAILTLAKSLDVTVTAEGVERQGQLEWLRDRGCHEAQGFLLSRPLKASDLETRFLADLQPVDARRTSKSSSS